MTPALCILAGGICFCAGILVGWWLRGKCLPYEIGERIMEAEK